MMIRTVVAKKGGSSPNAVMIRTVVAEKEGQSPNAVMIRTVVAEKRRTESKCNGDSDRNHRKKKDRVQMQW
ncbi:hypothetical protein [Robertmurraya sp. FSL R5-0851]|uniref:hypothetical protein n=1 Tax=Robertmurraya sp. FSL R5-0851 TaxID=2921584 RepID=UPI0030F6C6DA